jgi:hypothetical protein
MPLTMPQPPAAALRAVRAAIDSPIAVRALHSPAGRRRGSVLTAAHALPVHLLDPATATATTKSTDALAAARRTGWRFLIMDGEEVVAAAETRISEGGHGFSHFAGGPYPLATLRALRQAQAHTTGSPTVFLPRLLSVPGHYMTALWLHPVLDRTQSADVLIPLAPAPLGVTAHLPHDADELLSLLSLGGGQLLTVTT